MDSERHWLYGEVQRQFPHACPAHLACAVCRWVLGRLARKRYADDW